MNKFLGAVVAAASTLALAGAALAHPGDHDAVVGHPEGHGPPPAAAWNNQGCPGFADFREATKHDLDGLRHAHQDRSYTMSQISNFRNRLIAIDRKRDAYAARGGLSREECVDIQARLDRLHDEMHRAHDEGHAMAAHQPQPGRGQDWNGAPAPHH